MTWTHASGIAYPNVQHTKRALHVDIPVKHYGQPDLVSTIQSALNGNPSKLLTSTYEVSFDAVASYVQFKLFGGEGVAPNLEGGWQWSSDDVSFTDYTFTRVAGTTQQYTFEPSGGSITLLDGFVNALPNRTFTLRTAGSNPKDYVWNRATARRPSRAASPERARASSRMTSSASWPTTLRTGDSTGPRGRHLTTT